MIGFSPRALLNTSQHFSFPEYILMAAKDKMLHSEGHSASAHSSRHRTHRNYTALHTWPSLVNKTWRPAMTRRLRHKTLSTHRATDRGRRTVEREGQGKVVNVVKTKSRRPDFLADACTSKNSTTKAQRCRYLIGRERFCSSG